MPVQAKTAALGRRSAQGSPPESQRHRIRRAATSAEPSRTVQVDQLLDAVGRSIPLDDIALPEEFFPAHLPVALVDAVFRVRPGSGERPLLPAERYCRRFGISPRRTDVWELPEVGEQETLTDLMSHYDELGFDAMANEVFENGCLFPGTTSRRVEHVLNIAQALRGIGVEVLQDVSSRRPEAIDEALGPLPGFDEHFARRLLMYTGDDDFVRGDEVVRRFVARALGQETVSAARAANLVRGTAYELVLSPRYLDHQIWRRGIAPMH